MERPKLGEFLNDSLTYNVGCPWSSTVRLPRVLTVMATICGTVGLVYSYRYARPQKKAPGRSGSYKRGE